MWVSNLLILVDRNNVDHNELNDLAAAITDAGASVCEVNVDRHMIEATAPSHVVSTIAAMEGVSYVRTVFSYFCSAQRVAA
jgi:hypothetical protein